MSAISRSQVKHDGLAPEKPASDEDNEVLSAKATNAMMPRWKVYSRKFNLD